jgi:molecular chaperone DnaJ
MADKRDYYEVLGIDKSADEDTIKKAFRTMAKKYHPDLHPGDKEAEVRFKEVNEAYSVLSDPQKKAAYDRYGHAAFEQGDPSDGGAGFGGFSTSFGGFGSFGDIIEDFFGGAFGGGSRSRNAPRRGDDIGVGVSISFEEAAFGVKKDVRFNRVGVCPNCKGTGSSDGRSETCSDCGGTGQRRVNQRLSGMTFQTTVACETCRGTGKVVRNPCQTCRGNGYIRESKELTVNIPAGIGNGERLILQDEGNCGTNGGGSGSLIIEIRVGKHPVFTRDGATLFCDVPLTIAEAVLGAEIDVPTLEGQKKFRIPEGTQSGSRFTLKGCGLPVVNSTRKGDLVFTVTVEIPKSLNGKQKEIMRQFGEACGDGNYAKRASFFKRFRKQ